MTIEIQDAYIFALAFAALTLAMATLIFFLANHRKK